MVNFTLNLKLKKTLFDLFLGIWKAYDGVNNPTGPETDGFAGGILTEDDSVQYIGYADNSPCSAQTRANGRLNINTKTLTICK